MEIKLSIKKVVSKDKTYTNEKGKTYNQVNYYIVVDNGVSCDWIPFRPCFSKGYTKLDLIAETIKQ